MIFPNLKSLSDSSHHIEKLSDHLFRHEAGKMIAVLTKIFGIENLETAEDVVQQTFIDAMHVWKFKGIPDNPSAWLFRVAKNKTIDVLRKNKHALQVDFNDPDKVLLRSTYTMANSIEQHWTSASIQDDMLGMMFACCHDGISEENQITLILKTLCGFSTSEIAKAFLTSEDTISKRLYRTKEFFRQQKIKLEIPHEAQLKHKTKSVLNSIYLLFNEGYSSTHTDNFIRKDLIEEAMMLCKLLTENKHTQQAAVFALMALMSFHAGRSESRLSSTGEIILLPNQDRTTWDKSFIEQGTKYLNIAAFGEEVSTYHIEAAIAFEHCNATSYSKTNWKKIIALYDWLLQISPSPITEMNKAVAILQAHGPHQAIEALNAIKDKQKLEKYYLYHSLLGEIHAQLLQVNEAKTNYQTAFNLTQSAQEKKLLQKKLDRLLK